jgi:hypothetical protein
MKIPKALMAVAGSILVGCSHSKPVQYSVTLINDGKETIVVNDIGFTDDAISPGHKIECMPGPKMSATIMGFQRPPPEQVTLSWKIQRTGQTGKGTVKVQMPKGLRNKDNLTIEFHITPETQQVAVAYEIWDPEAETMRPLTTNDIGHTR